MIGVSSASRSRSSCCNLRSRRARPNAVDASRIRLSWADTLTSCALAATAVDFSRPARSGQQALTIVGQQGDAEFVAEFAREFEQLGDRRDLGQRDEHRCAARRVAQHLADLLGLVADRARLHDVGQPGRRSQERCGVPGGWCVDDDQVGGATSFEFLDLAEHEQVLEAWRGGGDHRQRRGRCRTTEQATDTLEVEVVTERLRGRDRSPTYLSGSLDPLQDAVGVVEARPPSSGPIPGRPSTATNSTSAPCRAAAERHGRSDRRRSDAALSGDDRDACARQPVPDRRSSGRRYRCGEPRSGDTDVTPDRPADRVACHLGGFDQPVDAASGVDTHPFEGVDEVFDRQVPARPGGERAPAETADGSVETGRAVFDRPSARWRARARACRGGGRRSEFR